MLLLRAIFIVCTLSAVYANTVDNLPCDIFKAGGTPCVAAHSTVRALYKSFNSSLYSVRRQKDNKSLDIGVKTVGGFADSTAQDLFCQGDICVFDRIYDQSPLLKVFPRKQKPPWYCPTWWCSSRTRYPCYCKRWATYNRWTQSIWTAHGSSKWL